MKHKNIKLFAVVFILVQQLAIAQTGTWKISGNSLSGTEKLGSTNSKPLNFITNNSTRMVLTRDGRFGIGTSAPEGNLHIFRGDAGAVTAFPDAPLVVESSTNNFINLMTPAFNSSGILFGAGSNNQDGAIVYNNADVKNGMQFNTGGAITRMTLTNKGFLGLGTIAPASELHIIHGNDFTSGLRLENNTASGKSWTIFEFGFNDGDLGIAANNINKGFFDNISGAYSTISDVRAKKNIESSPDVLGKVMQLQVKKYHFLENSIADKKQYGMIAQDVEKLFPEIVSHKVIKDKDFYAVNYSAYGVIAIKAIQEQQQKLVEQEQITQQQQQKIITLEERIAKLEAALNNSAVKSNATSNNLVSKETSSFILEQNQPNPFNQSTIIRYHLPQGGTGQVNVYDVNGRVVKSVKVTAGNQVTINGNDLSAGTYTYSLIVNGTIASSKKMVVIK